MNTSYTFYNPFIIWKSDIKEEKFTWLDNDTKTYVLSRKIKYVKGNIPINYKLLNKYNNAKELIESHINNTTNLECIFLEYINTGTCSLVWSVPGIEGSQP